MDDKELKGKTEEEGESDVVSYFPEDFETFLPRFEMLQQQNIHSGQRTLNPQTGQYELNKEPSNTPPTKSQDRVAMRFDGALGPEDPASYEQRMTRAAALAESITSGMRAKPERMKAFIEGNDSENVEDRSKYDRVEDLKTRAQDADAAVKAADILQAPPDVKKQLQDRLIDATWEMYKAHQEESKRGQEGSAEFNGLMEVAERLSQAGIPMSYVRGRLSKHAGIDDIDSAAGIKKKKK